MPSLRPSRVAKLLELPHRSKRERWARYYLLSVPPLHFNSPEHEATWWRIRGELQAEIRAFGYVLSENDSRRREAAR